MKKIVGIVLICIFESLLFGCALTGKTGSDGAKTGQFELRPYKEVTLSNGLKVLLVEDNTLPYFSMKLLVRSGASADPIASSGVASIVGELLNKGSTKRDAMQLADAMGNIASSLDVEVGQDFTLIGASTLAPYRQALLQNFSEMVTEPSFAEAEVRRVQKQVLSALQKTVDDPSNFAEVMFDSFLYGTHPYARRVMGRKHDVQRVRRKNVIKYYLAYYRPNNAQLAVVGHLGPDIIGELEGAFKAWTSRDQKIASFPEVPPVMGVQIQLIDKGDLAQTQIRIGHPGIKRTDPDFLKLRVANMILGGAFRSRLVDEIRDRRGLTYSISSEFDARLDKGPFTISTFTRNDKVGETVGETLKVVQEFRDRGVSAKEVEEAQALLRGMFPRALETAEKTAQSLLALRFYGVADSYLTDYLSDIGKISTEEVNEVVKKHFRPDGLKVLVYGSKSKILDQLRPIGVVQVMNYKEFIN